MTPHSPLRRALFSPLARRGWAAALIVLVLTVLALALSPGSRTLPTSGWDKIDHACAFAALAICGVFAYRGRAALKIKLTLALLALGVVIELAQTQVPGRSADWHDVVADAVGITLGLLAAAVVASRLDRRTHPREGG